MKKRFYILFLTTIFCFNSSYLNAQHKWSGGYQLNFGNTNKAYSYLTGEDDRTLEPTFTNQIFINRKFSKHFEGELALGYTSYKREGWFYYLNHFGGVNSKEKIIINNYAYNLTLSIKYFFLIKKSIHLFIPLSINNIHSVTKGDEPSWYETQTKRTIIVQNILSGAGLNYFINKRLFLNFQALAGYNLNNALQSFDLKDHNSDNIAYSFQAGIGYRF